MPHTDDRSGTQVARFPIMVVAFVLTVSITIGCNESGILESSSAPKVQATNPADNAEDVLVNTAIDASFSHEMNPSSINDTTFLVFRDTISIAGSIFYDQDDSTATFIPEDALSGNSIISARISRGVSDLEGNTMDRDYEWDFTTGEATDNAPRITDTNPNHNEKEVPVHSAVVANFNKPMDPSTINTAAFLLQRESTTIAGNVSYSESSAVFTPTDNLESGQTYSAVIKSSVRDSEGNSLKEDYRWNFSTEKEDLDTVSPRISSTTPADEADGVAVSQRIMATFSEKMNASTISASTFLLSGEGRSVDGSITYSENTAAFTPDENLSHATAYTATVTTGAEDPAGNPLEAEYQWTFTTEEDHNPPQVIETDPEDNEEGVSRDINISAVFNEDMDPTTLSEETFLVRRRLFGFLISVSGSVRYEDRRVTFVPDSKLRNNTNYSAIITDNVTDRAGNRLENNHYWTFNTGDDEED